MRQRKGTVSSFIFKWDIDVLREVPELEEASYYRCTAWRGIWKRTFHQVLKTKKPDVT